MEHCCGNFKRQAVGLQSPLLATEKTTAFKLAWPHASAVVALVYKNDEKLVEGVQNAGERGVSNAVLWVVQ